MSNKSVFKNPRLKAQKSSRNSFDLGYKFAYHASLGEIVPCCVIDVPAGSYVEIGEENQTYNFNPIVRPAFTRLKEHIDYFAVPKVQLWSLYDNFITGQSQFMSSALSASFLDGSVDSETVPSQIPMFDYKFLGQTLRYAADHNNEFGVRELEGTMKLLNYLGYGNYYGLLHELTSGQSVEQAVNEMMQGVLPQNFFRLLAYQKIYYSYYRNSKYESNQVNAYNIDWLSSTKLNLTDTDFNAQNFTDIFKLHYRWLKKDYFMSASPSVLPTTNDIGFNGLSASMMQGQGVPGTARFWQLFSLPGMPSNQNISNIYNTSGNSSELSNVKGQRVTQQSAVGGSTGNQYANVNVSSIRFAFAFDKLLRRMRSAGATFDDQMLAQFGIKPIDYRHGDAFYLGGYTNRLNVSEVTQTSLDGSDVRGLGQFGANISKFSANKSKISYHAKEDVIIMGIYSTSYDVDYSSSRYDRDNLKRFRFDFFNPAFENLGLQALYVGELSMLNDNSPAPDDMPFTSAEIATSLLAYNKRYLEYKTKVDTVAGLLDRAVENFSAMAWTTQYSNQYLVNGTPTRRNNTPLSKVGMLVNPMVLNEVVTTDYSGAWENDHFLINLYNDIKLVANMSIDGEVF